MKRWAIAYVVLLWVLAIVVNAKAQANPVTIYVVNHSSLADSAVADALPAFQEALDTDFGPAWNTFAVLSLDIPPPNAEVIELVDQTDVAFAAGYHTVHPGHVPYAMVGVQTGLNWQLVFSHEMFEMLVDPYVDRAAFIRKCYGWGMCVTSPFWMIEVGDPVERQWFTIQSPTGWPVIISDFVTERWYDCAGGGPLDFMGLVHHCHGVLHGGYAAYFNHGVWTIKVHGKKANIFKEVGNEPSSAAATAPLYQPARVSDFERPVQIGNHGGLVLDRLFRGPLRFRR